MSAGINDHCLDCRRRNQLHCLKSLTKWHKHYTRAHALWCAGKCDSLLRTNITHLTCGESHFHVMTLTFDLMTFNVCSASAVTWPNHVPNFRKTEKSTALFTGIILHAGFSSDPLRELIGYSPLPDPMAKFKLLMPSAIVASPLKLWAITAIPKFKDRPRDSGYAPMT